MKDETFPDLRGFLDRLRSDGDLRVVEAPVDPCTVVGKPRQEDFFIGDELQDLLSPFFQDREARQEHRKGHRSFDPSHRCAGKPQKAQINAD